MYGDVVTLVARPMVRRKRTMCAMSLYYVWRCSYLGSAAYGAQEEDHVPHEPVLCMEMYLPW